MKRRIIKIRNELFFELHMGRRTRSNGRPRRFRPWRIYHVARRDEERARCALEQLHPPEHHQPVLPPAGVPVAPRPPTDPPAPAWLDEAPRHPASQLEPVRTHGQYKTLRGERPSPESVNTQTNPLKFELNSSVGIRFQTWFNAPNPRF